jgi:hypothetical protein
MDHDSRVNILGAKLGSKWRIKGNTATATATATATLGHDQGSNGANSARVFALGEGFTIYIGGRVNATNRDCVVVAPRSHTANVVNILGAISRGKDSTADDRGIVADRNLTVANG